MWPINLFVDTHWTLECRVGGKTHQQSQSADKQKILLSQGEGWDEEGLNHLRINHALSPASTPTAHWSHLPHLPHSLSGLCSYLPVQQLQDYFYTFICCALSKNLDKHLKGQDLKCCISLFPEYYLALLVKSMQVSKINKSVCQFSCTCFISVNDGALAGFTTAGLMLSLWAEIRILYWGIAAEREKQRKGVCRIIFTKDCMQIVLGRIYPTWVENTQPNGVFKSRWIKKEKKKSPTERSMEKCSRMERKWNRENKSFQTSQIHNLCFFSTTEMCNT